MATAIAKRRTKGDLQGTPAAPVAPVPTTRKARISGLGEPPNLSTQMDAERIQAALRAADRGDTWQLFTIYRDELLGYTHLQSEWLKRKSVIVGQPYSLIPKNRNNPEDVKAADCIAQMIDECEDWIDGLIHLLDATLYPVSVVEKIFQPVGLAEEARLVLPTRYLLKSLAAVNYTLLCFKVAYLPTGSRQSMIIRDESGYRLGEQNPAMIYNVDDWEPDLRFYDTNELSGYPNYSMSNIYAPEKERHLVHRGNMLSRSIRDNFGGQMRACLFWWLLATRGRDWFGIYMQKYGSPFILGKADVSQKDTVDFLKAAFSTAVQIGGLVIDKKAEAELIQASAQDGANAHKILQTICNDEISKLVVGQVLSSSAKNTGLGSGVANLHGEVRQDIRLFDMRKLSDTLRRQLFTPYLRMNGYAGRAPDILWGGEKEHDALALAQSVNQFSQAGLRPTESGIQTLSHRIGYDLERGPEPQPKLNGGRTDIRAE